MRAPVLAAGLALLVVLPWLSRRFVGDRPSALLAWLLALSPSLVLFARIARPYAPVVFLGGVAVLGFYRWWSATAGDGRGGAVVYAVTAPLAVYFHLGAAPFVAAPMLFAVADGVVRRIDRRRWLELVGVGGGAAGVLAVLLLPARRSLLEVLSAKSGASTWSWSIVPPVAELLAGSSRAWVAVVFWLLVLLGLGFLVRRRSRFAAYSMTLVAAQMAGLWLLAPFGIFSPLIVERYLLVAWPLVALWLAEALAAVWPRSEAAASSPAWRRRAAMGASVVFLAGLLLVGPLATVEFRRSSFVHHDDFLSFVRNPAHLEGGALPDVYRRLATDEDPGALIEFPFRPAWRFARAPYLFQRVHGRRVLVSSLDRLLCDPQLALSSNVCPRPPSFLASPARFLVVHLDIQREEDAVAGVRRAIDQRWPRRWQVHREAGERMAAALRSQWGAPDLETDGVLVWDLARVRQQHGPSSNGIN